MMRRQGGRGEKQQIHKDKTHISKFYIILILFFILAEITLLNLNSHLMFDKYIINLNPNRKMVKIVKHQHSKYSEDSSWDQKQSIYEECQQQSTIPPHQAIKKENLIPDSPLLNKSAKIKKERKKRQFNPEGRFLPEHRLKFFLFPFYYSTQFPYCKISWENWKPSGYFIKMAEFLSDISPILPGKTGEQCKSFDQRQKKEIYTEVDLLEAAFLELKSNMPSIESLKILEAYVTKMESRSQYMSFICQNMHEEKDWIQSDIATKKEDNYQSKGNGCLEYSNQGNEGLTFNEFLDDTEKLTATAKVL